MLQKWLFTFFGKKEVPRPRSAIQLWRQLWRKAVFTLVDFSNGDALSKEWPNDCNNRKCAQISKDGVIIQEYRI